MNDNTKKRNSKKSLRCSITPKGREKKPGQKNDRKKESKRSLVNAPKCVVGELNNSCAVVAIEAKRFPWGKRPSKKRGD